MTLVGTSPNPTPSLAAPTPSHAGAAMAAWALTFNAFVWGVSWWPFRQLQDAGLHPLWATAFIYTLCVAVLVLLQPKAVGELLHTPSLWVLVVAAGVTNSAFNWAVTVGDVVRVVLLFYLMPVWAVLLARVLLNEAFTWQALARVALALAGAMIVLGADAKGLPWPASTTDWLALLGGFSFALNNVMLRHQKHRSPGARTLAMFVGGAVLAAAAALALRHQGVNLPPALAPGWLIGALALGLAFLAANLALQLGASRLSAHATAVIMLTEVFFASASAWLLGAAQLDAPLLLGGALIVAAALLAAWGGRAA